jgi:hypothetical protein
LGLLPDNCCEQGLSPPISECDEFLHSEGLAARWIVSWPIWQLLGPTQLGGMRGLPVLLDNLSGP